MRLILKGFLRTTRSQQLSRCLGSNMQHQSIAINTLLQSFVDYNFHMNGCWHGVNEQQLFHICFLPVRYGVLTANENRPDEDGRADVLRQPKQSVHVSSIHSSVDTPVNLYVPERSLMLRVCEVLKTANECSRRHVCPITDSFYLGFTNCAAPV